MNRKIYFSCLTLIIVLTAFFLIGQKYVYRYPRISYDVADRAVNLHNNEVDVISQGAYLKDEGAMVFRAFAPDVSLHITAQVQNEDVQLQLENIHPQSSIQSDQPNLMVQEKQQGLIRTVTISGLEQGETLRLKWPFPDKESYQFVAVGDTGGGKELTWSMMRAEQLKADFILHLGDAYYTPPEVGAVGTKMNESAMPIYTANGNHDFRGPEGNAIETFTKNVSPLNAQFNLLGHCFINLDTGAYMYPAHKGMRAKRLAAEVVNHARNPQQCKSYIVFTHKPILGAFEAEFPKRNHSLNGGDAAYLLSKLQQLDNVTLLVGHIHLDFEFEQDGMKTYVTGNGLAQTNLVRAQPSAKVLVGKIFKNQTTQFTWAENNMPMQYHCSQKVYKELIDSNNKYAPTVLEACRE